MFAWEWVLQSLTKCRSMCLALKHYHECKLLSGTDISEKARKLPKIMNAVAIQRFLRYPGHCASGTYPWRTYCQQRTLCRRSALFAWVGPEEKIKTVDWAVMVVFAWWCSYTLIPSHCWLSCKNKNNCFAISSLLNWSLTMRLLVFWTGMSLAGLSISIFRRS